MEIVKAIPDLFTVPLGLRNKLPAGKPFPFLVFEDISGQSTHFPFIFKESKLWTKTKVVDWSKLIECRIPDIKTLKDTDPLAFKDYVNNLLFRYVMGIPDQADRNFLYIPSTHSIYSIDEESINKSINLYTSLNKNKAKIVYTYIKNNWQDIKKLMNEWFIKLSLFFKDDPEGTKDILDKLLHIQNLNYIKAMFSSH